jgi:uracil-DNA glycosylase
VSTSAERQQALDRVRDDATRCRACPLWEIGRQTVFGTGPVTARLLFIGEAPGAQEDKHGVPLVGPAGRLFDEGLAAAGIPRELVYLTNAVKHRPSVPAGQRRKNRPPKQSEINACRPWLQQELALVRPRVICCLGAVAARCILGRAFRLTEQRGQWLSAEAAPHVLATVHPSYVLIQPEGRAAPWREIFFGDLARVGERFRSLDQER